MAEKIMIFGKSGWPYTDSARQALKEGAEYYDVKKDSEKLEEMLKYSNGVRKVPVIVKGGEVTVGYGGSWGVWSVTVSDNWYLVLIISSKPVITGMHKCQSFDLLFL